MDIYKRFCEETQTKPTPENFFKAFAMEYCGLEATLNKLIGYTRASHHVSLDNTPAYYWANNLMKYPLVTKRVITIDGREFPKGTECKRVHNFYVVKETKQIDKYTTGYYHVEREDLEVDYS